MKESASDEDAVDAEFLLQRARSKGLGSRVALRLTAITLWSSFLGAIPILLAWLWLLPHEEAAHLDIAELSIGFFMSWLAATLPAILGVSLTHSVDSATPVNPPESNGRAE